MTMKRRKLEHTGKDDCPLCDQGQELGKRLLDVLNSVHTDPAFDALGASDVLYAVTSVLAIVHGQSVRRENISSATADLIALFLQRSAVVFAKRGITQDDLDHEDRDQWAGTKDRRMMVVDRNDPLNLHRRRSDVQQDRAYLSGLMRMPSSTTRH